MISLDKYENIFQVICIENQEKNQLIENKLNSYKW